MPGREHDDARVVDPGGRGGAERLEQPLRVVGDAADAVAGEQLGEHVGHRPPVLDHVRDPRRRAQVVLEHPEGARAVAHEVDAGDVHPHAAARVEPGHAPVEVRRARDEATRHDAVGEDLARAVDVGEEPLEREHPLADARLDHRPLLGVDDARHEVERERPLLAGERERDALVVERAVPGRAADLEVVAGQGAEDLVQRLVVRARLVGAREHLVPGAFGCVAVEEVAHRCRFTRSRFRPHFGSLPVRVPTRRLAARAAREECRGSESVPFSPPARCRSVVEAPVARGPRRRCGLLPPGPPGASREPVASAAMTATADDHRDAAAIATEAGRLLVALRATMHADGADPADLRAEGDRSSHDFIVAALAAAHPDDAVLSEEAADDPVRLGAERVWIVDPLDGTREFGEEGRTDWAVHVALTIDGQVVAAAVALPARAPHAQRRRPRPPSRPRTTVHRGSW